MKLKFRLHGLHMRALPKSVQANNRYPFVYIGDIPDNDDELEVTIAFGSEKDKVFYSEPRNGVFGPWINYEYKKL